MCGTFSQGTGASVLLSDDPSEGSGWVDSTGRGVLRWEWGSCCSDGMVFGPLPVDTYCLNIRKQATRAACYLLLAACYLLFGRKMMN